MNGLQVGDPLYELVPLIGSGKDLFLYLVDLAGGYLSPYILDRDGFDL